MPDYRSAMLYSLNAMTSYGHTNLSLEDRWQLMGALEALNGSLLFGLSIAPKCKIQTDFNFVNGQETGNLVRRLGLWLALDSADRAYQYRGTRPHGLADCSTASCRPNAVPLEESGHFPALNKP
jgi:hypothetical protein